MNPPEMLARFLQAQTGAALDLLREMVGINSFTANPGGVNQLGALTAEHFKPLGFTAEFVSSVNPAFGNHLVLTRAAAASAPVMGFISHLDTVFPPEEEKRNQFSWRSVSDRIYGPGTMDIKGGTVMIHLVLGAIRSLHPSLFDSVTWVVLLNSSEETLSRDFGQLCLQRLGPRATAALVFEAGGHHGGVASVVTARKGRAVFNLNVTGRGAHAGSQHSRGANAIVQFGDAAARIAALTDYSRDLTFNVGTVTGGTVVNRVPHHASALIEMRAFRPEVYQAGIESILRLNGPGSVTSPDDGFACGVSIELAEESPPWPRNPGTDRLFEIWKSAGDRLGIRLLREERGGISDGNYLWQQIPTLDGLGPYGDNAHCSESSADGSKEPEYVAPSSFSPRAALTVLGIVQLLQGGSTQ